MLAMIAEYISVDSVMIEHITMTSTSELELISPAPRVDAVSRVQ